MSAEKKVAECLFVFGFILNQCSENIKAALIWDATIPAVRGVDMGFRLAWPNGFETILERHDGSAELNFLVLFVAPRHVIGFLSGRRSLPS